MAGAAVITIFVAIKVLSRVCRDKYVFAVTENVFCHDKRVSFATKICAITEIVIVAAPADDTV